MKDTGTVKLIDEICKEKGIDVKLLSFGWIRELKKDGKICHIVKDAFDLNPAGSFVIVNDKYATYEVLKNNNLSVLKHRMLFNQEFREEYAKNIEQEVENAIQEYGKKLVIKANDSSEGKEVYLVQSKEEALNIIQDIFSRHFVSLSICPFEEIEAEYRVICLDGEILYVYKKIAVDWKHNLSRGAQIVTDLENDEKIDEIKKLALKAFHAVNARFVSVDISKKANGEIFVMEINGSVCMSKFIKDAPNGKEIAKKVYSKAIDKMFDE